MSTASFRPTRIVPLLGALADFGPVGLDLLCERLAWPRETVQKTLENTKTFGYADHDGARERGKKVWDLTPAGWDKLGLAPRNAAAPKVAVPHVVNPNEARPWAFAATGQAVPPATPAAALPSIDACEVAGLPMFEVDIDAIHYKRAGGMAEPPVNSLTEWTLMRGLGAAAPADTEADTEADYCSVPQEPDFLCALYSDGALSIQSGKQHLVLTVAHTRKLLHYLEHLGAGEMLETGL